MSSLLAAIADLEGWLQGQLEGWELSLGLVSHAKVQRRRLRECL
ncbi:hypothetical protein [Nostoc sp.]